MGKAASAQRPARSRTRLSKATARWQRRKCAIRQARREYNREENGSTHGYGNDPRGRDFRILWQRAPQCIVLRAGVAPSEPGTEILECCRHRRQRLLVAWSVSRRIPVRNQGAYQAQVIQGSCDDHYEGTTTSNR